MKKALFILLALIPAIGIGAYTQARTTPAQANDGGWYAEWIAELAATNDILEPYHALGYELGMPSSFGDTGFTVMRPDYTRVDIFCESLNPAWRTAAGYFAWRMAEGRCTIFGTTRMADGRAWFLELTGRSADSLGFWR